MSTKKRVRKKKKENEKRRNKERNSRRKIKRGREHKVFIKFHASWLVPEDCRG
jgi:hypothetical protein